MELREIVRYLDDLGWRHPPELPAEPEPEGGDLGRVAAEAAGCTACRLARTRTQVVFGDGDPDARLMFVGEGPGAEEDRRGLPFVGPAGRLLDAMIAGLGLERSAVYICNVVKCRPPRNRNPQPDETEACSRWLDRQIELVAPEAIVALGKPAAQRLLGGARSMGAMRGRWGNYRGVPVLPTYHPAYLLRTPRDKRLAWDDLRLVADRLRGGTDRR